MMLLVDSSWFHRSEDDAYAEIIATRPLGIVTNWNSLMVVFHEDAVTLKYIILCFLHSKQIFDCGLTCMKFNSRLSFVFSPPHLISTLINTSSTMHFIILGRRSHVEDLQRLYSGGSRRLGVRVRWDELTFLSSWASQNDTTDTT